MLSAQLRYIITGFSVFLAIGPIRAPAVTVSGSADPVLYVRPFNGNLTATSDSLTSYRRSATYGVDWDLSSGTAIWTADGDLATTTGYMQFATTDSSTFRVGTVIHANTANTGYDTLPAYDLYIGDTLVASYEWAKSAAQVYKLLTLPLHITANSVRLHYTQLTRYGTESFREGTLQEMITVPDRLLRLGMTVHSSSYVEGSDWNGGPPACMLDGDYGSTWEDTGVSPAGEYWAVLNVTDGPKRIDAILVQNRTSAGFSEDISISVPDGLGGWNGVVDVTTLGNNGALAIFRLQNPVTTSQLRLEITATSSTRYIAEFMAFQLSPPVGTSIMIQ